MATSKKNAAAAAPAPDSELNEQAASSFDGTAGFADDDDDDEGLTNDEDQDDEPAPRRTSGRPRTGNRPNVMSATGVFKDEDDYQNFCEEATERNLSVSAYALTVFTNRHNTTEGAANQKGTIRQLRNRVLQLEGAKETLQGLYEVAAGIKAGASDSLAGLDDAPVTGKTLSKAVDAEITRRETEKLAKEAPELQKKYDALLKDFEDLEDEMERQSSFMVRAQTLGPGIVSGLMAKAPGLATALAGLGGFDVPGLPAGPSADSSDPLVMAALRTRDNVSPIQGRELMQVLDAVARRPDFISRFAAAIQQFEQAQQPKSTEHGGYGPG